MSVSDKNRDRISEASAEQVALARMIVELNAELKRKPKAAGAEARRRRLWAERRYDITDAATCRRRNRTLRVVPRSIPVRKLCLGFVFVNANTVVG